MDCCLSRIIQKKWISCLLAILMVLSLIVSVVPESAEASVTPQISTGRSHYLALKPDGTVWAWGVNDYGQLGIGSTTQQTSPVQVPGLTGVIKIAAGGYHSLAVKSDGTVWAWGDNTYGQLGDGTTSDRLTPVQVSGLTNVTAIATSYGHSLAVKSDGTVWSWGYNHKGELGDGTTTERNTPVQVQGLTGTFVSVAAGGDSNYEDHSLAIKSDGTVWGWGYSYHGQLGVGGIAQFTHLSPEQATGLTNIISVAAGRSFSIALKADGTVWAMGDNTYGQLGDGKIFPRATAVQVTGLTGVVAIDTADAYSLAVKSDGTVWGWGLNDSNQLLTGTESEYNTGIRTPTKASGITNATAPSTGGNGTTLILESDGTVLQHVWQNGLFSLSEVSGLSLAAATPTVTTLTATPDPINVVKGDSKQLTVTATMSDGSTQNVTNSATYHSDNAEVATVSSAGVVNGVSTGTANVTITFSEVSVTVPVTVVLPSVTSISVAPNPVSVAAGLTQQVTVTATLSDGTTQDITNTATYSINNANANINGIGLITGVTQGTANATIAYDGKTVTVPVTVTAPEAASLRANPNPVVVDKGETQQMIVSLVLSDGTTEDITSSVAYSIDNTNASVTNGLVLGQAVGTANITVDYNGETLVVPVVVTEPTIVNIYITADTVNITQGESQPLSVTAVKADGTTQDITGLASYSASNSNVSVDSNGVVTGVSPGSSTVTALYNGEAIAIPIKVTEATTESLIATPNPVSVEMRSTQQLTITATVSDRSTQDVTSSASYQSDNTSYVTVSSTGLVTGVGIGTANVTVTYNGETVVVPVTVTVPSTPMLTNLTVSPNPVSIVKGNSQQLTVTATMSDGTTQDVTDSAVYQSDSSYASVNNAGLVKGVAVGTANVAVNYDGKTVVIPVTVTAPSSSTENGTSLTISPNPVNVVKSGTQQLTVTATMPDGTTQDVTSSVNYYSDNKCVSVNRTGLVKGVAVGTANVTVKYSGATAVVPVTVTTSVSGTVTCLTASPNPVNVVKSGTQQLTVTATMPDGTTQDVTSSVIYQSDSNKASVSRSGLVKGVAVGTANVTVKYSGATVVVPVTVTNL